MHNFLLQTIDPYPLSRVRTLFDRKSGVIRHFNSSPLLSSPGKSTRVPKGQACLDKRGQGKRLNKIERSHFHLYEYLKQVLIGNILGDVHMRKF